MTFYIYEVECEEEHQKMKVSQTLEEAKDEVPKAYHSSIVEVDASDVSSMFSGMVRKAMLESGHAG